MITDEIFEEILQNEIQKYQETITEHGYWNQDENRWSINLSAIDTHLIQNIGRFVERFASDYLITRFSIENRILNNKDFKNEIVLFSLRESGVDSNGFTLFRLSDLPANKSHKDIYRKIYALTFEHTNDKTMGHEISATLYDITGLSWLGLKNKLDDPNFDPNYVPDKFVVGDHTFEFNDETALGEPTAWVYLSDKTSIEITHESYKVETPYFSIRRHCSDKDFDDGIYHKTCGIISTDTGSNMSTVIEILSDILNDLAKKNIRVTKF